MDSQSDDTIEQLTQSNVPLFLVAPLKWCEEVVHYVDLEEVVFNSNPNPPPNFAPQLHILQGHLPPGGLCKHSRRHPYQVQYPTCEENQQLRHGTPSGIAALDLVHSSASSLGPHVRQTAAAMCAIANNRIYRHHYSRPPSGTSQPASNRWIKTPDRGGTTPSQLMRLSAGMPAEIDRLFAAFCGVGGRSSREGLPL